MWSMREHRLEGDVGALFERMWQGETLLYENADGEQRAFRIFTQPLPQVSPTLLLMRLDPTRLSYSRDGVELLSHEKYSGMMPFHDLWTRSTKMKELFQIIERVAEIDVTVLVRGESGTGKERVAQALHSMSKRANKPFVAFNCAAFTPTLLESELFGHVKGAFTGAIRDHQGLLAAADGGTIFLDEIAEMPLELQAKLLRVLQERVYTPVGGTQPRSVDVRLISATHRSLRQAVMEGSFREDLMYRLRVVPLWIPPLRDRREDIEPLLSLFLQQLSSARRHIFSRIHPAAMQALLDHPWPGNVRELQNVVAYASAVGSGDTLMLSFLPPEFRESDAWHQGSKPPEERYEVKPIKPLMERSSSSDELDLDSPSLAESERNAILDTLRRHHWRKGRAAEELGMHRTTLWRKIKEYGLDRPFMLPAEGASKSTELRRES
ncbi:MAG: sigma-54-dependent Fis family transcriptional regulator [Myxococcales bacterium]|nr:sigma-54-dependent Fis family transcriptional regulator [Myxococcales bacterium]MCB9643890.1 sigma-54-dependent Fis family transcriptional regulator [Myxococcales bacterium]